MAIVNMDSEYADRFLTRDIVADNLYTVGFAPGAQIRAENVTNTELSTEFDVRIPSNQFHLSSRLPGNFNISNILCAVAVLMSQKIDIPTIQSLIAEFASVPGRLEVIPNTRGAQIYVDYAHTEDSLRSVLSTLRQMDITDRLITVFGATGDRDRNKRPKMGKVVDELSDVVILTDDDTYTEDSVRIIRDVTEGISRREGEGFWIIPSREDAIRTACIMLRPGDVLVVAGK